MNAETHHTEAISHAGDCSYRKPRCLICDCGALRRRMHDASHLGSHNPILDAWRNHLAAIEASIDSPPLTAQEQRRLRVDQDGEPLDPQDTSNWGATTGP